jgi:hypothetical protein
MPSKNSRMPASKPVPVIVTGVPPVSGPATGAIPVNDIPGSCVTAIVVELTRTVVVLGVGSGFRSARNAIAPLPRPRGIVSQFSHE